MRNAAAVSAKYFSPFNTFHSPGVDYRKEHDFLAQGVAWLLKASRDDALRIKTPEFPIVLLHYGKTRASTA